MWLPRLTALWTGRCQPSSNDAVMIVVYLQKSGAHFCRNVRQRGKVQGLLHGDGGGVGGSILSHAFHGAIACGVTQGNLLPICFPPCWALPRRQRSMLGEAQLSLGMFPKWEQ